MNNERRWGALAHKAMQRASKAVALAIPLAAAVAQAQSPPPGDGAPSEAARRAAMSPYRFILQNATAPARKPAPPPEAKKPPAPEDRKSVG